MDSGGRVERFQKRSSVLSAQRGSRD